MIIGGLQKFSLLDYPGKISAIVFTQGCNFRCHFCYNPLLVCPMGKDVYNTSSSDSSGEEVEKASLQFSEDSLFDFLKTRVGKIDAVVITGGEPTLQRDLTEFARKIKSLGFLIKLDSNGTNPKMIKDLLEEKLLDYIAMDIKAPLDKYERVVSAKVDVEKIKESVEVIKACGLPYEFRTTLVPGLHEFGDIEKMGKMIEGADKWFLQGFKSDIDLINTDYVGGGSFSEDELKKMLEVAKEYVKESGVR